MGDIVRTGKTNVADAVKDTLGVRGGSERHRLCFDFNNIEGLKRFFANVKTTGITHPDSIPVLLHSEDNQTVWLVGFKKKDATGETLGDV